MSKLSVLVLDCLGAGAAGLTVLAVGWVNGLHPWACGVPALVLTLGYLSFVYWLNKRSA